MRPEAGSWLHRHECRRADYSGIIRRVPPVNITRDADDFRRVRGVLRERDAPRDRIAVAEIVAGHRLAVPRHEASADFRQYPLADQRVTRRNVDLASSSAPRFRPRAEGGGAILRKEGA